MTKEQEIGEILLKLVESDSAKVVHQHAFSCDYYETRITELLSVKINDDWFEYDVVLIGHKEDHCGRYVSEYVRLELNLPKEFRKKLKKAFIANEKRYTKKKNDEKAHKYSEAQQQLLDQVHEALKKLA